MKVLIVDDMPAVRGIVRNMLEELELRDVEEAEDGREAWECLRALSGTSTPIELVIADWNMPAMSGVELLQAVRGNPETRHVRFILITGDANLPTLRRLRAEGEAEILIKPFTEKDLGARIQAAQGA